MSIMDYVFIAVLVVIGGAALFTTLNKKKK